MKSNNCQRCPYERANCHAYRLDGGRGICSALQDVSFKDKAQLERERIAIKGKLMSEGRTDLLEKYYGK